MPLRNNIMFRYLSKGVLYEDHQSHHVFRAHYATSEF